MIENPEISINYSLSYRDFVAGQKLAARKSVALLLVHIVARYVALILAIPLTAIAVINISSGHGRTVPGILLPIFLLFLLSAIFPVSWRYSFKRLQLVSGKDADMTFQADSKSFSRQIQGMGDITWLWSATHAIAHNKKVLFIAARRGAYIFIPRSAVSDAQLQSLYAILKENRIA